MSWDNDGFYEMSFGINRSRRYHDYMRDCYRRCNEYLIAASVIAGSGALLTLGATWQAAPYVIAVAGIGSLLNFCLAFGKKADKHDALSRRFTELATNVAKWTATANNLKRATAERLKIEQDEPPVRRLIDLRAHNDELSARGVPPQRLIPLSFWQRSWLAYHFTFGETVTRQLYQSRLQTPEA